MLFPTTLILVRGAGDLATGVIYRLRRAGFPVIATETPRPLAVRRTVAFAQAVYDGDCVVEGMKATRVETPAQALTLAQADALPILPNPSDAVIAETQPVALIDARLLKRADAADMAQAPLVIGLGPGFEGGRNCHAAIETNRGHRLGRIYWQGATEADTGIPGVIAGYRAERLLRAPVAGVFQPLVGFGEHVERDQVVGTIEQAGERHPIRAALSGVVRGLLYPGLSVTAGAKLGDVDPRDDPTAIYAMSEKSLAIGGAVLAAILTWLNERSSQERNQQAGI